MESLYPEIFFDLSNYQHRALFQDCDFVWEALMRIKDYLHDFSLGQIEGNVSSSVHLVNASEICIGEGTVVEPGAYIKGPCIIGRNCTVRHGAYLRGNVIVGDDCIVGHDTEIKHSIMLNYSKAAHFAYLGDSILGNHVNLGAGTKCANLRFDDKNIKIRFEGQVFDTGLRKIGGILGDGTRTGCNTVANPGTITGKGVCCYPGVVVGGLIPSGQIVKQRGMESGRKRNLEA